MWNDESSLALPLASLVLTLVLSVPAICSLLRRPLSRTTTWSNRNDVYEDLDGISNHEAVARFSNRRCTTVLLLLASLGLSMAVVPILFYQLPNGNIVWGGLIRAFAWMLLLVQAFATVADHSYARASDFGRYVTLCSIQLLVFQLIRDMGPTQDVRHSSLPRGLRVMNLVNLLALGLAGVSIPRRPDVYHNKRLVDRELTGSTFARLTWGWSSDLLRRANADESRLDLEHLPRPSHALRTEVAVHKYEQYAHAGESVLCSILRTHQWSVATQWCVSVLAAVVSICPQWTVLQFLRLFERNGHDAPAFGAWVWVIGLGLSMLAQTWIDTYAFWVSHTRLALPVKAQLSSFIFRKSLKMEENQTTITKARVITVTSAPLVPERSLETPQITNTTGPEGSIHEELRRKSTVNLVGVDTKRVADFCQSNSDIIRSTIQLLVSLIFLTNLLGWKPLLAGFAAISVFMPINILFSRRESSIQRSLMQTRETKTASILQLLQGIRQIKFAAHESQWEARIDEIREQELGWIWASYMNNLLLTACWISSPILLAATSLCTYAAIHKELAPSVAFVSLAVFESLEVTLSAIPGAITAMLDAWISAKRIDEYLRAPEKPANVSGHSDGVVLQNVSVSWQSVAEAQGNAAQNSPGGIVLKELNVKFPPGELSVIAGATGGGKSMLLKAILGEARVTSGSISRPSRQLHKTAWIIPGTTAYVSQTPWLESTTIRGNILFGLPYQHDRYAETIRACALTADLNALADRDDTEAGAGGTNLSGGQRWRVTLARALYSRAELLIMDDIFSAVDPHVGRHILEHALTGDLSIGRTRILATHHSELCKPKASLLVELDKGSIAFVSNLTRDRPSPEQALEPGVQQKLDPMHIEATRTIPDSDGAETLVPSDAKAAAKAMARDLAKQEKMEQGAVKSQVYAAYITASGGWKFWVSVAVLFVSIQAVVVGKSWWMKLWTASSSQSVEGNRGEPSLQTLLYYAEQSPVLSSSLHYGTSSRHAGRDRISYSTKTYLGIYVLFAVSSAVLSTSKQYYVLRGSIKAFKSLFTKLNSAILHAPLSWLNEVPHGRILNRMTSDFYTMESEMSYAVIYLATAVLNLLSIVAVGVSVSPIVFAVGTVCLAVCVKFTLLYLGAARSLKRLESITRSPIYDQLNSVLAGVATIRSFDKVPEYIARMDEYIDDSTVAAWYLWLFNSWIAFRIGIVGSVFASLVAAMILLTAGIDASLASFTMAFTIELSGYVMASIQRYANMELEMSAAERIVEYCELPTEDLGGDIPPAAWPTQGHIEIDNLVVGYGDSGPVLNGVSFDIQPGERIGVVGRTGAGKSTLVLALFRMMEAQSGGIYIDGTDISRLNLQVLRSRMAIVPQDPVLFAGSIRSNLDPFNVYDNRELVKALEQVYAGPESAVTTDDGDSDGSGSAAWFDLSSPVSEGGLNLSQGQRQLVCLARLAITPAKIVVLDEATSAVDMKMDEQMQRSIREITTNSTLVVIAHRLSTVADFDRLVVLEQGQVAEFGTPRQLWEKGAARGKFRAMCEQSGERDHLEQVICGDSM